MAGPGPGFCLLIKGTVSGLGFLASGFFLGGYGIGSRQGVFKSFLQADQGLDPEAPS